MITKRFNVYKISVDTDNGTVQIDQGNRRCFFELEGLKMKIAKGAVVSTLKVGGEGEYEEFKGSYNLTLDMMNFIRSAKKGEVAQKPKRSLLSRFMGS